MRQPLKQPHEMFSPDPRSTSFARLDATGPHSKTIEEHHRDVAAIRLSERVPAAIRHEFDTVRNLYLYSWYVYDFTVAADLYAYALMEKTIKEKCLRSDVPLRGDKGLKKLLKLCIREGWLTNADFELAVARTNYELVLPAGESEPPVLRSTPRYRPADTDFCEQLAESLPQIRNMARTERLVWACPRAHCIPSRFVAALPTPFSAITAVVRNPTAIRFQQLGEWGPSESRRRRRGGGLSGPCRRRSRTPCRRPRAASPGWRRSPGGRPGPYLPLPRHSEGIARLFGHTSDAATGMLTDK